MRSKSLVLLLLVIVIGINASRIDSLETELKALAGESRLVVLIGLMDEYSWQNPAKALEYGIEAVRLAEESNNQRSLAEINRLKADSYYYLHDIENSLLYYKQAAEIVLELDGKESAAYGKRLGDVGYCLEMLIRYDEARAVYEQSLEIAKTHEDWQETIALLNNIGNIFYSQAQFEKSLEYLQEALRAEEEHGEEASISTILNSIALIYQAWKDEEKTIAYFQRALEIDRKYKNPDKIAIRLNNLGIYYRELEDFETALNYLLEALEIEREINNPHRLANRLTNVSSIYISLEQFENARQCLDEIEIYLENFDNTRIRSTYYENYGNYYFMQKQYAKAVEYHLITLELAEKHKIETLRQSSYSDLSAIYSSWGRYEEALFWRNRHIALLDSLFDEEKHKQIAELELKYETEKKQKEIELLKKNAELHELEIRTNRTTRNFVILVLFLIILLVIVIFISYGRKQEVMQAIQAKKAMEQSRLAILGELIAGIVHEVNQPLQSLSFSLENMMEAVKKGYADQSYLEKKINFQGEDVERMERIINHIRTFSRNNIGDKQEAFDLNESIQNALRMTSARLRKHNVKLEIDLAENLPKMDGNLYTFEQVILILLSNATDAVQQMSENSDKSYHKKICIRSLKRDNEIVVQVGDNGAGIPESDVAEVMKPFFTTKEAGKGTGLGLAIAHGIIDNMNGSIQIETVQAKGTIIKLSFRNIGD
jgi:signal transduction histidine kinase/Tfp pilus assembly protein PilF